MHNESDVAVAGSREGTEGGDDGVLPVVAVVALLAHAYHELHVVHHHVRYVVHVARVLHSLDNTRTNFILVIKKKCYSKHNWQVNRITIKI